MNDRSPNLSRRAFLGMQALALSAALGGCARQEEDDAAEGPRGARSLEEIQSSGYVNIGISSDARPLSFLNKRGNYDGMDQYCALYLASKLKVAPVYVSVDLYDRYDALLSGTIDLAVSHMSPQDRRADEVVFSQRVYSLKLGIVSPSDARIESVDQLADGELIVCEDSYAQQYAAETWPNVATRAYNSLSDAYGALKSGHGAAMLSDELTLAAWVKRHAGYALGMKEIGDARTIAPAIAPGMDDYLEILDDAVASFISGGWRSKAYTSDVKPNVSGDYSSLFK